MKNTIQRVKLSDIAKVAGVSVATVSMALGRYPDISSETRTRVRELCRKMNYRPRRKIRRTVLAGKRVRRLALVLVGYSIKPESEATWLRTVLEEGASLGCRVEVAMIPETDDASQAEQLGALARDVDAILLDGYVRPALLESAAAAGVPALLMGNFYADPVLPINAGCQVTVDMRGMGHLAARVLLRAGHCRIAFVCHRVIENLYYEQWLAGYRHAHADAGLLVTPSLLITTGAVLHAGMRAAQAMLHLDPVPTAAVIPDAGMASIFLEALRSLGRELPREAVVIGGSREQCARFNVDHYPNIYSESHTLVRASMALLVKTTDGEPLPNHKVVVPFDTANLPPDTTRV